MTVPDRRAPGRPRSLESHRAILRAAEELLAEVGYASVTIDGIAARAGVGKQTIYRWWPTKADLILEIGAEKSEPAVPVGDHGSYAADLRAFLSTAFAMAVDPHTGELLRGLMTEAQLRDDFAARFRTTFLRPRRDAFRAITERAAQRGELPLHPSAEVVADIVFGTLWYRLLTRDGAEDADLAEELVAVLAPE